MLLLEVLDGPIAGATFTVDRCPQMVRCVQAADGTTDILNGPDDVPRLDEVVHWYRWDGHLTGHMCSRGRGCIGIARLVHAPQPVRAARPWPGQRGGGRCTMSRHAIAIGVDERCLWIGTDLQELHEISDLERALASHGLELPPGMHATLYSDRDEGR